MSDISFYPHPLPDRTIRLLNIEPGDSDSPLQCTLQETLLETTTTPYYALSYVWGSDQHLVPITCNCQIHYITPNLHSVLLEYRSRDMGVSLWVDALCINQNDTAERTSQVRMMQEIYSRAACVVVWLGEADEAIKPALQLLKEINAPWATMTDHQGREIPLFTGGDHQSHDACVAGYVPDSYFDALAGFLLRPWFGRIWIVQELLCARKVVIWCGSSTLDEFPVLEAAARLIQMHNVNVRTQVATVALADPTAQTFGRLKLGCAGQLEALKLYKKEEMTSILRLVYTTRAFGATDPRDKIFALVGLANDVDESFVDYSKSYQDVISEFSRMFLEGRIVPEDCGALDIWSCITREEDQEIERQSWAVDWCRLEKSLYTPLLQGYPSEEPVIVRRADVKFVVEEDENEVLHITGTLFDHIAHIIPSPYNMSHLIPQSSIISSSQPHLASIQDWQLTVGDAIRDFSIPETEQFYPFTREPIFDAYWRTLCCNRSSVNVHSRPTDESGYHAWRRLIEMQLVRLEAEKSYRYSNKLHKRWFSVLATFSVAALTYRFRRHKFLAVAIPFTLGPMIQYFNKTWNQGLSILLVALQKLYLESTKEVQIEQRDFEGSHSQWCQERQFFVATNGFMGWCPLAARVGDVVGLFAGCRIPYVLRAGERGRWRIVGDAYVHGIMDGEVEKYGTAEAEGVIRIE